MAFEFVSFIYLLYAVLRVEFEVCDDCSQLEFMHTRYNPITTLF